MPTDQRAHATLRGGQRFSVTTGSGHTLTLDSSYVAADPAPMELLLASLVGCLGMSVIGIARKQRQDIISYTLDARGVRAEQHPQVYRAITVEHVFTGRQLDVHALRRAVQLAETTYCPISAMLASSVSITHSIQCDEAQGAAP